MADIILFLLLALILGSAGFYLWRARKRGIRCIGCPAGGSCHGSCSGCSENCSGCCKDK